jgi:C4-dicarboxylate-specific signal transduction histidine kinase
MTSSGSEIGIENVDKLRRYLDSVDALPARGGKLNVQAVAIAAGLDRQALYKNPACRKLLEEAVARKDLQGIEQRLPQASDDGKIRLERRIGELERTNAALMAEVDELRQRLRRFAHIEGHLVQSGRLAR